MIQFNLLPDVKIEYLKARRTKRIVLLTAGGVAGVAFIVLVLLFLTVNVFQKKHLNDLNKDIKRDIATLQNTKDLDKILTIQNQLNSLPGLHSQRPVASRLFNYINQLTPTQVNVSKINTDFAATTINVSGSADSLATINKFVDTLKFTEYKVGDGEQKKAFSDVVLSSFSKDEKSTTYEINLKFDSAIFNGANNVSLVVPKTVTTRSQTEKPTELFKSSTGSQEGR